jgi:hypothetical protein
LLCPSTLEITLINHSQDNIDLHAMIEAQRKLTHSKEPYERVVGVLCVAGMLKKRLARLNDEELGQLLVEYVSNELTMFSPEAAICEEAAQRLFRAVEEECLSAAAGTARRQ